MTARPLASLFPVRVSWLPLVGFTPLFIAFAPPEWPRWLFMWGLAVAVFVGCKWLTWTRSAVVNPSPSRHLAYWFAWAGLDANAFLKPVAPVSDRPGSGEWLFALFKFLSGLTILFAVARLIPPDRSYLVGWVGMLGIVLVLHFGSIHLLSCYWRSVGVDAKPLMNWPVATRSLSDFWGRRWNVAFRDLTHQFLFRPLLKRVGPRWSLVVGFLFSGAVHDVVISVPARGGYGRPTLFFVIQGVGIFVERSALGKKIGLGSGWRGRLFSVLMLAGPAAMLFHPPFVNEVVLPFLRVLGAIP